MCAQFGCRVWLEWVPSKSNPADILSRAGCSEEDILRMFKRESTEYRPMVLPAWTNQKEYDRIDKVLESVKAS